MLSPQNVSYSCSHVLAARRGLAFKPQMRAAPCLRVITSPAERSRRRCFEIAGRLVRKFVKTKLPKRTLTTVSQPKQEIGRKAMRSCCNFWPEELPGHRRPRPLSGSQTVAVNG